MRFRFRSWTFVRPRRHESVIDQSLREAGGIPVLRACSGPFSVEPPPRTFSDALVTPSSGIRRSSTSGISVSNRPTERIIRVHPRQHLFCSMSIPTSTTHQFYHPGACYQPDATPCPGIPAKPTPPLPRSLNGPLRLTSRTVVFVLASGPPRSRHQQMLLLVQGRGTNCSAEADFHKNLVRSTHEPPCAGWRLQTADGRSIQCAVRVLRCIALQAAQLSTAQLRVHLGVMSSREIERHP